MTPTQGEHAQTEALNAAQILEYWAKDLKGLLGSELLFAAAVLRRLHAQVAALTAQPAAPQGVAYADLEKKHRDFVETVGLMLDAIGYKEDYARQWPKEKASITFKRWFDEQRASNVQAPAIHQAGACVYHIAEPCPYRGLCVHCQSTPTAQAAPATPFNTETQDHIAAVMLQHGTEDQQRAALAYASTTKAAQAVSQPAPDAVFHQFTTGDEGLDELLNETFNMARGPKHNNMDTAMVWQAALEEVLTRLALTPADSVLEDAARLDYMIENRAYVVSDPAACPGHWLHYVHKETGGIWVQGDEHPTPRAAIDAARKQGGV